MTHPYAIKGCRGRRSQLRRPRPTGRLRSLLDLDRGRLLRFDPGLRNVDGQHTVPGVGTDRAFIDAVGQREAAREGAVETLDFVELLVLLFRLLLALAAQGEPAIRDGHGNVVLADAGQGGADQVLALGLADVHRRRPVGAGLGGTRHWRPATEPCGHPIEHVVHCAEGFPTNEAHDSLLCSFVRDIASWMLGGTAAPLHSHYCVSALQPSDLDVVGDAGHARHARRGVFSGVLIQKTRHRAGQHHARVPHPNLDVGLIDSGRTIQLRFDVPPDVTVCPTNRESHACSGHDRGLPDQCGIYVSRAAGRWPAQCSGQCRDWRASRRAMAQEARRASVLSARLVRITGTRAPSTMPAICAPARYSSCLASMLPASRSGTMRMSARPATGERIPLARAASGETALSKASGPSSTPPVIWPRSAILHSTAASSVDLIRGDTVSTAERIATRGLRIASTWARSIAFWTMSAFSSTVG